jgi:hypothetical protein
MEVDMTWLEPEERKGKKRPPPIPGSNVKAPPMPVVEPVRRETMEVRAEWLDPDPKSRRSMLPVKLTDEAEAPKAKRSRASMPAMKAAGGAEEPKARSSRAPQAPAKGKEEPKRRPSRASLAPAKASSTTPSIAYEDQEPKPRKARTSLLPVKPKDKKAPPIPREE